MYLQCHAVYTAGTLQPMQCLTPVWRDTLQCTCSLHCSYVHCLYTPLRSGVWVCSYPISTQINQWALFQCNGSRSYGLGVYLGNISDESHQEGMSTLRHFHYIFKMALSILKAERPDSMSESFNHRLYRSMLFESAYQKSVFILANTNGRGITWPYSNCGRVTSIE